MSDWVSDNFGNIIAAGGLIVSIFGGFHWIYKHPYTSYKKWIDIQNKDLEQNKIHREKVTSVLKELEPNGGGSIKDKINKIAYDLELMNVRYDATLYIDSNPIFINDKLGNVIFVNAAWLEMTGFNNPKDAMGFGWMKALPEEEAERLQIINETLTKHPSSFMGEIIFKNIKTQEIIKTNCRTTLIRDSKDNIVSTIGTLEILK